MNTTTILRGAFLALCLVSLLALPAAAAQNGQAMNGKANLIDQELKDDLWTNHVQYRLKAFDMHVQHGTDIIKILTDHNIDTRGMQGTLDTFSGKRSEFQTALENQDKEAVKKINDELRQLRQEFLKEMRDAIRNHYASTSAANTARTAGIAGMTAAGVGTAAL